MVNKTRFAQAAGAVAVILTNLGAIQADKVDILPPEMAHGLVQPVGDDNVSDITIPTVMVSGSSGRTLYESCRTFPNQQVTIASTQGAVHAWPTLVRLSHDWTAWRPRKHDMLQQLVALVQHHHPLSMTVRPPLRTF